MRILVVDDEEVALTSVRRILRRRGLAQVEVCDKGSDAVRLIREEDFDVVILDVLMPEIDGLHVLENTKPFKPRTEFIMVTAVDDIPTAVRAIQLGAYDYLVKPVDNERLILCVDRAQERRALLAGLAGSRSGRAPGEIPEEFSDIITQDARMMELLSYARIMAASGNPILVTGESGTGKELLARGIHRAGPFSKGPFIAVNVSAVPETMFENQFFGHEKGAFTGADARHAGYFEQADRGTLFLDEIGEMPLGLQVKLLRVVEEKSVTRLGGTRPVAADIQIVSATNADLDEACRQGRFRLDLMYRLRSAHIHLPPLRERQGDIPLMARHFLKQSCLKHNKDIRGFGPEAMDVLTRMSFSGNIRELAQVIENAVLLAHSTMIEPTHLGEKRSPLHSFARTLSSLKENDEVHTAYVLTSMKGDLKETARILGVSLRQAQRRIARMKRNPQWKSILAQPSTNGYPE